MPRRSEPTRCHTNAIKTQYVVIELCIMLESNANHNQMYIAIAVLVVDGPSITRCNVFPSSVECEGDRPMPGERNTLHPWRECEGSPIERREHIPSVAHCTILPHSAAECKHNPQRFRHPPPFGHASPAHSPFAPSHATFMYLCSPSHSLIRPRVPCAAGARLLGGWYGSMIYIWSIRQTGRWHPGYSPPHPHGVP